jgi:hypothetical protein
MLVPFRHLPMVGSLGVACFGSAERTLGKAALTMGDVDLGIDHLERAVDGNQRLGNDVLGAIAAGELGCALISHGAGTDRARGRVHIEAAISALTSFGLQRRADELREFADANAAQPIGRLERSEGTLRISFGDSTAVIADSIGARRLAQLLIRPFVDLPVGDLVGGLDVSSRQELIDATALRAYRDRVSELRADIDAAEDDNDIARAERLRTELDTLLEHLSTNAALGQRSRQFATSQERARVAVRKSLSRVFEEIATQAPRLAALLGECVHTGLVCRFEPHDPLPAVWQIG